VAVAPGEAFGGVGHLRVSFGVSDHELEEGVSRLVGYLTEVRGTGSATRRVAMSGQVDQDETGMASGCRAPD
jgi:hypothetical protein